MSDGDSHRGVIPRFAGHRVAANLLMLLMILGGLIGLQRLNTQLFPDFEFDFISVNIIWQGASPEDVEQAITIPVEQALKTVPNTRSLIARSTDGRASLFLEMEDGTDLNRALDQVRQRVEQVRNLPADAERPAIRQIERYSPVANLVVYTQRGSLAELRPLAREMENQLLARGIGRVEFAGLPDEEMAIQVPSATLQELGLPLDDIAARIREFSRDIPAGTLGRDEAAKQLRALGQRRDESGFADLAIFTDEDGRVLRLGDFARIERRPRDDQPLVSFNGHPAIELQVLRTEQEDSLESARIMNEWLAEFRQGLPDGVDIEVHAETWQHLRDRIRTLLFNGLTGLALVIAVLFFFLNARVARWVTIGIPVSFLATLAVLYAAGGSINMISLFGLILALGIIVDDAIVVGEDTLTHLQKGHAPLDAAVRGARRMFWPVVASSLTTIAAFAPLALMGGPMGKIAFDIPFVMICVIIASLVECFLVLPGHLHHSFASARSGTSELRQRIDAAFHRFREERFRRWVTTAIEHRYVVVTAAFCAFALAVAIVASGWLRFTFFPPVDANQLRAVAEFHSGTDPQTVDRFMDHLKTSLREADEALDERIVSTVVQHHGVARGFATPGGVLARRGDEYGTLLVEVDTSPGRRISNDAFLRAWRERIEKPPGLDKLTLAQPEQGPPGRPVEIRLSGADTRELKEASLAVQQALSRYAGISNVDDDLPWGNEQLTFELTSQGRALGLTLAGVARQLRGAFDGSVAQMFNDEDEEVEVRVMLPDTERRQLAALDRLPILSPAGETLALSDVVTFSSRQGVDLLRRVDSARSVVVSADLDPGEGNASEIVASMSREFLPELQARHGLRVDYEGRLADQAENLRDIRTGLFIGLALIYLVLTWVFSAWSWPLVIMTAIMFGFVGAVIGHLFMGLFGVHFSMFSIMGLFGLSGIIVNDSIVLLTFYQQLLRDGLDRFPAIVEACTQRLRAVLLTSITTIAGLTPILFEGSMQAQFLKPMAVSIVFGLAFGTVLILAVVPSMLMILEDLRPRVLAAAAHLRPAALLHSGARAWQFRPAPDSGALQAERGLGGSLAPAMVLMLASGALLIAELLRAAALLEPAAPGLPALVTASMALLLAGWGLAMEALLRHRHQAPGRTRVFLFAAVVLPLGLTVLLEHASTPAGREIALAELAVGQWRLAAFQTLVATVVLPLLFWSRRAAATFSPATRGQRDAET